MIDFFQALGFDAEPQPDFRPPTIVDDGPAGGFEPPQLDEDVMVPDVFNDVDQHPLADPAEAWPPPAPSPGGLDLPEAVWDFIEPMPPSPPHVDTFEPGTLANEAGDASQLDDFWHHQGPENACAVVAQGSIIEAITGIEFDQRAATTWLSEQGWYTASGGTSLEDLTRLIDAYGIEHTDGPASIVDIYDAIQRGDQVMVGLDANEIWYPKVDPVTGEPAEWLRPGGHAVWVTDIGFDEREGEWKVVLNDSGHPGGRACEVALDDFLNATDDYGHYTVIVDGSSYRGAPSPF